MVDATVAHKVPDFETLHRLAREYAQRAGRKRLAVAQAADEQVLLAVRDAFSAGIVEPILTGSKERIRPLMERLGMDQRDYAIVDVADTEEAAREAVRLVSSGQADLVMKGVAQTSMVLRAVLDKQIGLRTRRLLNHVAIYDIKTHPKLLLMSDAGMVIEPTLMEKVQIIENAVVVANALGISEPKVAVLSAVDTVNPAMPKAVEAAALSKMSERGQIRGCIVDGPLTLDAAVMKESAEMLGVKSRVAGNADILIVNSIEEGNVLSKSLSMFAKAGFAGVIVGARKPVLVVSRADSPESKLNSIALGVVLADHLARLAEVQGDFTLATTVRFDS